MHCTIQCTALYNELHCTMHCTIQCTALHNALCCTMYCTVQCTVLYNALHYTMHCTVQCTALYIVLHLNGIQYNVLYCNIIYFTLVHAYCSVLLQFKKIDCKQEHVIFKSAIRWVYSFTV